MNPFFSFMSSSAGRLTRIGAGAALIAVSVILRGGWIAIGVVGLVPLVAGVFDFCIFAPVCRLPLSGKKMRQVAHQS